VNALSQFGYLGNYLDLVRWICEQHSCTTNLAATTASEAPQAGRARAQLGEARGCNRDRDGDRLAGNHVGGAGLRCRQRFDVTNTAFTGQD